MSWKHYFKNPNIFNVKIRIIRTNTKNKDFENETP